MVVVVVAIINVIMTAIMKQKKESSYKNKIEEDEASYYSRT